MDRDVPGIRAPTLRCRRGSAAATAATARRIRRSRGSRCGTRRASAAIDETDTDRGKRRSAQHEQRRRRILVDADKLPEDSRQRERDERPAAPLHPARHRAAQSELGSQPRSACPPGRTRRTSCALPTSIDRITNGHHDAPERPLREDGEAVRTARASSGGSGSNAGTNEQHLRRWRRPLHCTTRGSPAGVRSHSPSGRKRGARTATVPTTAARSSSSDSESRRGRRLAASILARERGRKHVIDGSSSSPRQMSRKQRRSRTIPGQRGEQVRADAARVVEQRRRVPQRVEQRQAAIRVAISLSMPVTISAPASSSSRISLTRKNARHDSTLAALLQAARTWRSRRRCRAPGSAGTARRSFCSAPSPYEKHHRLRASRPTASATTTSMPHQLACARILLHVLLEFLLERASVPAHPEHHLHDKARRDEHHRQLEVFAAPSPEQRWSRCRASTRRRTIAKPDARGRRRPTGSACRPRRPADAAEPCIQDAYHQHGLGRFAPDDEQCVAHDVYRYRVIWRRSCLAARWPRGGIRRRTCRCRV